MTGALTGAALGSTSCLPAKARSSTSDCAAQPISSLASCPRCLLALFLGVDEPDRPLRRIGRRHEFAQSVEDLLESALQIFQVVVRQRRSGDRRWSELPRRYSMGIGFWEVRVHGRRRSRELT